MSSKPSTVSHPSVTQMIRRHADWLALLPQDEEFPRVEVPDEYHGDFESLRRTPAIEVVGSEENPYRENRERYLYELAAWAVEMLEETLEERETVCPCGHSGLQNRGDHYECSFALCEQTFSRDELEVNDD